MRGWVDPFSGRTWQTVSDAMYGNKQHSSSFETESFTKYICGQNAFPPLPSFRTNEVRSFEELLEVLAEPRRAHYIEDGSLTFRGQPAEYKFRRKIPNPVRADKDGYEVSILPGLYRQKAEFYSFAEEPSEERSFARLLRELEPNNPSAHLDAIRAYDIMRTEQHYATQTAGLDLAFEAETAIFFATHHFRRDAAGIAYYEQVSPGEHCGVIYCFRFRDPPVKKTQYLIKDFDLFKTFPPLRILRQDCGLPLIGPYERNIALTDIDCVIRLHADFVLSRPHQKVPHYMFPSSSEDKFYKKLLELKDANPDLLSNLVEYKWARK